MLYAIYFLVFLLLMYSVRKKLKQSKDEVASAKKILSGQPVRMDRVMGKTVSRPSSVKNPSAVKSTGVRKKAVGSQEAYIGMKQGQKYAGSTLRDDRTNDWLARQLRDEHSAFKMASEMFGLKIEHSAHCDAKLLKHYHHLKCDASGVDTAEGH